MQNSDNSSSSSPRLYSLIVVMGTVSMLWLISARLKNTAIIDPYWGFGFFLVGLVHLLSGQYVWNVYQWLLIGMVMSWGLRLSLYLGRRFVKEGINHEDYRYANFRRNDPENYWWKSLMKVFWLQGLLIWIFSQIVQSVLCQSGELAITSSTLFVIGTTCWLIGVLFETFGDWQLETFKSKPENKGKVLDTGLWKYTRHPNYFGDSMVWIGFAFMSLGVNFSVSWYHLFLGPIAMVYLLLNVTGKPLLEKHLKEKRPEYVEYIRKTSSFIPWFPKQ